MNSQGIGLGLLISNTLAQQLSKDFEGIHVDSVVGNGSTFKFILFDFQNNITEECIAAISSHRINKIQLLENKKNIKVLEMIPKATAPHSNSLELRNSLIETIEKKIILDANKNLYPSSGAISFSRISNPRLSFLKCESSMGIKSTDKIRSCMFIGDVQHFEDLKGRDIKDREIFLEKTIDLIKILMQNKKCSCPVALVIDDNDFNILALTAHLKRMGIKSQGALSTDLSLKFIKEMFLGDCCKVFKIIFLDIEMPIKDGFIALEEITEFYKERNMLCSNIIAVTAHSKGSERFQAIQKNGINKILTKPILLETLVIFLKNLLVENESQS